jgi:hypothetical protein
MLEPAEFTPHPLTDRARKIRANLARAERDNGSDNLTNTISAIRALGDLLRSEDSTAEDHALEALHAGRAVFWSSATYHNHAAVRFLQLVNTDMALEDALAACVIDGIAAASEFALLATLIPLNPKARVTHSAALTTCALKLALAVRRVDSPSLLQAAE